MIIALLTCNIKLGSCLFGVSAMIGVSVNTKVKVPSDSSKNPLLWFWKNSGKLFLILLVLSGALFEFQHEVFMSVGGYDAVYAPVGQTPHLRDAVQLMMMEMNPAPHNKMYIYFQVMMYSSLLSVLFGLAFSVKCFFKLLNSRSLIAAHKVLMLLVLPVIPLLVVSMNEGVLRESLERSSSVTLDFSVYEGPIDGIASIIAFRSFEKGGEGLLSFRKQESEIDLMVARQIIKELPGETFEERFNALMAEAKKDEERVIEKVTKAHINKTWVTRLMHKLGQ